MTRNELEKMSLAELKQMAKERGLQKTSSLRKAELIDLLAETETVVEVKEEIIEVKEEVKPQIELSEEEKAHGVLDIMPDGYGFIRSLNGSDVYVSASQIRRFSLRSGDVITGKKRGKIKSEKYDALIRVLEVNDEDPEVNKNRVEESTEVITEEVKPEEMANGILEIMPDGFGFIRSKNYLSGDEDVYVSPSQIRRFRLKTGDVLTGVKREKVNNEKYEALLKVLTVNDDEPEKVRNRIAFEDLTPVYPNERIVLEQPERALSMRIVDLLSPVGKGQRGMIVSPPKAGKTTLLKEMALSIQQGNPDIYLLILLIDERPEEVTDMMESVDNQKTEIIYSTFDEQPERHKRVSEMTIERAKRLVEQGKDVVILLDSITRLARAYNLTVAPSGRTLSGGLDPASLYMPKRFFGAARNTKEAGSLTILATALVETGSKMDDVVYEEFKGTGNMELVLSRRLQERRIFPAIDIFKSGTRREDLLLNPNELETSRIIHKSLTMANYDETVDNLLNLLTHTKDNKEFVSLILNQK